jgi:hypothetical protein
MRRKHALVLAVAASLGLLLSAAPARTEGNDGKVAGTVVGTLLPTDPLTAEGHVTGDLAGTWSAVYSDFETLPNGTITAVGMHMIVTANGTLFTVDDIVLHPTDEPGVVTSTSRLYIVGGTGRYDGAHGKLTIVSGSASFVSGEISLGYEGHVHLKQ